MLENFKKIGEYREPNKSPVYIEFIGRNKSKGPPIVYLFVVEGVIKYIGESRRGYNRPLSYNSNKVMVAQRTAIEEATKAGNVVEVWAYEVANSKVEVNGIEVDVYVAQDYEKVLIKIHDPEWNGRA